MNYKTYEVRVYESGKKEWFLNGKLHREDGPAIEHANGDKSWYLNGKLHRVDGPAVEYKNGEKFWFLFDYQYLESDWGKEVNKLKNTCNGKTVEIDGKKYKLMEVE